MARTLIGALLWFCFLAATLSAQDSRREKEEVPEEALGYRVRVGDDVHLHASSGELVKGRVEDYDGDRLRVDGRSFRLSEGDVQQIDLRVHDSLKNGALIGLGVGAGLSALACAGLSCSGSDAVWVFLFYGSAGSGIGALFDALHVGQEVVYRAPPSGKTLTVAPLLGRDRKGVLLSIRF